MDLEQVIKDMKSCYQTEGQTIYEHGESVRDVCLQLIDNDIHEL